MTTTSATTVLKRRVRPWPSRTVSFVDLASLQFIHENGRVLQCHGTLDLGKLLQVMTWEKWDDQPRVCYIVGGWDAASTPVTEWFAEVEGWERTSYHRDPFIASYKSVSTGKKVTLYMTSQWFGRATSADVCRRAFIRLRALLRGAFDSGVSLMGTPARTGLDLIERSLPDGREYQLLPDDLREKLEHNIGQGRMEFIPPTLDSTQADTLYILDGIWMYAACCRRLPVGPMVYDNLNMLADDGYRPGFYHVQFQVPAHWQHIGLLPSWDGRPVYPCESGTWHEAYVCNDELRFAMVEHGWRVQIVERWLFANDADPLRTWIEKLRSLRAAVSVERDGDLAKPLRDAIRAICIKAIGGLSRKGRYEQVETPIEQAETLPEDAIIDTDALSDTVIRWLRPVPLDASMTYFQHPEWAAMVWGRARARLARATMELPREAVIALRTDAIISTLNPEWEDDGKPGTFRVKEVIDLAGRPVPTEERTYRKLLAERRAV